MPILCSIRPLLLPHQGQLFGRCVAALAKDAQRIFHRSLRHTELLPGRNILGNLGGSSTSETKSRRHVLVGASKTISKHMTSHGKIIPKIFETTNQYIYIYIQYIFIICKYHMYMCPMICPIYSTVYIPHVAAFYDGSRPPGFPTATSADWQWS